MSDFETVSIDQVPDGAVILDVREDYEFAEGHVPDAIHIPLGELPVRYEELDPDTDTYIICRTGGRNIQAAAWLVANPNTRRPRPPVGRSASGPGARPPARAP